MSNPSPSSGDFIHELFRDALTRIDSASDRFEAKLDNLEKKMLEMQTMFQEQTSTRLSELENKVEGHGEKLVKHEHNFNMLTFIFTSGLAGVTAIISWFNGFFGGKPPHQ